MDTDDGVEVVWNEVRYSNRKIAKGSKVRYSDRSTLCCLVLQTRPNQPQCRLFSVFSGFCINEEKIIWYQLELGK